MNNKGKNETYPPPSLNTTIRVTLSVLLSAGISASASADDFIVGPDTVDKNGNLVGSGLDSGDEVTYGNISAIAIGTPAELWGDTTEAFVVKNNSTLNATDSVHIVNVSQHDGIDNNGGIYARDQSTINFTNVESVYIAAIAGSEGKNDSTAISAKTPYPGISDIFDTHTQIILLTFQEILSSL